MRFYTQQHRYYCGIDLHARRMYVCILDSGGEILVHRNVGPCPSLVMRPPRLEVTRGRRRLDALVRGISFCLVAASSMSTRQTRHHVPVLPSQEAVGRIAVYAWLAQRLRRLTARIIGRRSRSVGCAG